MRAGQVVKMKKAIVEADEFEGLEFTLGAINSRCGDRLVFLLLGHEEGGKELDAEKVLRQLGWVPADEVGK